MRELLTTCDGCKKKSKKKYSLRDRWRRGAHAKGSVTFEGLDLCTTCKRGATNAARGFLKGRRNVYKK